MSQSDESSSSTTTTGAEDTGGGGEIMLFGVRVKVDPMRKSVSMNNLSQYHHLLPSIIINNNNNMDVNNVAADTGYATADDAVRNQSNPTKDRKRGVPWTEDEHKLFLLGLQKVGKGDWRGISRNFVKTRTPTQVASHAQKYFLRKTNLNRRRRRSSLFDITADLVTPMSVEEQVHEDNQGQPIVQPSMPSSQQIFPLSGFPATTFPSSPVLQPIDLQNPVQMITFKNDNQVNNSSMQPRMDLNLNQKYETEVLPVSLNLSLSFDQNQSVHYQVVPGFKSGDNMISVN
uniref:transcription factor MYB1R1-like n=1 Tax=Erigeron canadensis TaxID=72917 RepID=UPI001CB930D8|nr:transcription factor MYB1R1-like [Erigeron canadensis]